MNKWISAGGVVLESLEPPHRVFVRLPSNNWGPWSLPKGKVDEGETHEEAAVREVQEESGVPAQIIGDAYLGAGVGQHSLTHYYLMVRSGPVGPHDNETQDVRLMDIEEAAQLFLQVGNKRDHAILLKAMERLNTMKLQTESIEKNGNDVLNELHLNTVGKVFFATVGAWLVGKAITTKLRGSQNEVKTVANVLLATKRLQEELYRPTATVESIVEKIGEKHMSAKEFERTFNVPWPL